MAIINNGEIVEHGSTRSLLDKLHTETFVLNLRAHTEGLPELSGYNVRRIDTETLEVDINKDQNINDLFALLSRNNLQVRSMRNKVNRLEELFLRLVDEGKK